VCVLAIGVGFTDTPSTTNGLTFLDWQRVCAYAIYFYAGLVLVKREHVDGLLRRFNDLIRPWMRFAVGYSVLGAIFGAYMLSDYLGEPFGEVQEWLLVVTPYGVSKWYHPIIEALWRVALYLAVALASVAFMSVVPTGEYFFTQLGSRTLTAYLLHRVFITTYTDITTKFWDDDDIDVAFQVTMGVFVLPLLVSQVCLSRAVTTFFAPFVDPASRIARMTPWIFHARHDAYDAREEEIVDVAARDGIETPLDPTDRDVGRAWRSGE
jgi:fucose 4-O-acetylase-like acetyltransferase